MHHTEGLLKQYITGFILSLVLSFASFVAVQNHLVPQSLIIPVIMVLAFIQLIVQLHYFLHLSQETKPRWNLTFFIMTAGVILLVMVASLWIMQNLNYRMTPEQMQQYIQGQDGL